MVPTDAVMLRACMGGWCTQRDHCGAFHAMHRVNPSERLCARGDERPTPVRPVAVSAARREPAPQGVV